MTTPATNNAARQAGDAAQAPSVDHPRWRARVDPAAPEDVAKFEDLYVQDNPVRVYGPRGPSRDVSFIAQALGNGVYRLKDITGRLLPGTYGEANLRLEGSSSR